MSSTDNNQESNLEDSSSLNVSKSDVVDHESTPILHKDNSEVQNKLQAQSNNKLFASNDGDINDKKEISKENKKKSILDLFDDDSDPFESDKKDNDKIEIRKGEKQLESKLLIGQLSDILVNKKLPEIEAVSKKVPETKPKHDKQVKNLNVEGIEGNNSKPITQSTKLPIESNSLFDDDKDLFPLKSEKVNKPSSNIFDSDDEFEFNHTFTKKKSVKTKSIFGDDSDDDLFSTPSKLVSSNLSNQKPIG